MDFKPIPLASGKEICCIAVTYHPDAELPNRLSRILQQVSRLVIVDNGSSDAEITTLQGFAANPSVTLMLNFTNLGIASALNNGIDRAAALGFKWVLLLDQDSCIDDDMVQTLISVQAAFPDQDRLAVIGSGFRDADEAPREPIDESRGSDWEEAESVITSGSLIPLAAHTVVGPFREEFFIDYVDTEYCFRAARDRGNHPTPSVVARQVDIQPSGRSTLLHRAERHRHAA
jgi:rhamnosyltransferase